MHTVNIHEAKTHLSRFVDQAAAGEGILISRAGKPQSGLIALAPETAQQRPLGLGKSRYTLPDEFDQPLCSDHSENVRIRRINMAMTIQAYLLTRDSLLSKYSDLVKVLA